MAKHQDMNLALEVLKTLSHPVRLSILCNLMEKGEMTAGEISDQESALASQSQVSQYLKLLKKKEYVTSQKRGLYVYYQISSREIQDLIETMHKLFCPKDTLCK